MDAHAESIDKTEMDWSKPSLAVVCKGRGPDAGCVLVTCGPHVAGMIDDCGERLGDIGLDDAPLGISIWEGTMRGGQAIHTMEGLDHADTYLDGKFREPTPGEWACILTGTSPWNEEDWRREADEQCLDCGAFGPHHCAVAAELDTEREQATELANNHHPECNDPQCGGGC